MPIKKRRRSRPPAVVITAADREAIAVFAASLPPGVSLAQALRLMGAVFAVAKNTGGMVQVLEHLSFIGNPTRMTGVQCLWPTTAPETTQTPVPEVT